MNEDSGGNVPEADAFGIGIVVEFFRREMLQSVRRTNREAKLELDDDSLKLLLESSFPVFDAYLVSEIDGVEPERVVSEYLQGPGEWDSQTKSVIERATKLCPEGRVLDIGCGAGRFLMEFGRKGYEVIGIDQSPGLVWLCKHRTQSLADVTVEKRSIFHYGSPVTGQFDVQVLLGHNLGIGGSPEGVSWLLERCGRLSVDGGVLLVNSIDITASGDDVIQNRVRFNRKHNIEHDGVIMYRIEFGPFRTEEFQWIHVTPEEVGEWSRPFGWRFVGTVERDANTGQWSGVLQKRA